MFYRLERADTAGIFTTIADTIVGSTTAFVDRSTTAETAYTYRLTAINRSGILTTKVPSGNVWKSRHAHEGTARIDV